MTCHGLPFSCQYSRRRRNRAGEPVAASWPCSPEPSAPSRGPPAASTPASRVTTTPRPSSAPRPPRSAPSTRSRPPAPPACSSPTWPPATPRPTPSPSRCSSTEPRSGRPGPRPISPTRRPTLAALTQLGVAYRGYEAQPGVGFDCSGLTSWAWGRAGVQIAHQSSAQISAARRVDESAAVAGDIVQYPGHVMLYLGVDRAIVHASNPSTDVELSFVPRSVRFGDPEG